MEGGKDTFVSPLPPQHVFARGDLVHVFEGTGVGNKGVRSVGWFGRVVGSDGSKYLVRNRLLSAKLRGSPNLVDGQFLKLQTDYSLSNKWNKRGKGALSHPFKSNERTRFSQCG